MRPEHVRLADRGSYRGEVIAAEYLGTTQIVTLETPNGQIKARILSDQRAQEGERVALTFVAKTLSLFDGSSGRALRTALNDGAGHG